MINDLYALEKRVSALETEVMILRNLVVSPEPGWFKACKEKLQPLEKIPFPFIRPNSYGSYDYYRIVYLLEANKIILSMNLQHRQFR